MSKYGIRYKYNRRKGKRGRDASESTIIRSQRQKLQEEEQAAALREFQEGARDILKPELSSLSVRSSVIFDSNIATPKDVEDRIRQQDERYMSMLRQGEEITPEWRAYGQKRANSVGESSYSSPAMKK